MMKKEGGIKLLLERNAFYRDNYKSAYYVLLLLLFINVALIVGIVYKVLSPVEPEYFAASGKGRIIKIFSLTDPVFSDSHVLQWAADKVQAAFNIDYVHWRQELQNVSPSFTQQGWYYFNTALKSSLTLKTVVDGKTIGDAKITGAPKLLRKMVVGGHYAWKIEMPLEVTYLSQVRSSIPMIYDVIVIVLRMPIQDYPDQIAINNFLPNLQPQSGIAG